MAEEFADAAVAIFAGDIDKLTEVLADDPLLSTRASTCGHPTLLQLVACEAESLGDPVAAALALVEAGASTGPPLVAAAGCGSRSVLEFLLDGGADIDGDASWSPLDEALYWAKTDIAAALVGRGARPRALSTAAGLGDLDELGGFFGNGELTAAAGPIGSPFPNTLSDATSHDRQCLIDHAFVMAVNNGQRATTEDLLGRGARVNFRPPGYHWHGTALHAAVWRGDPDLVGWLLAQGADRTIRDDSPTATPWDGPPTTDTRSFSTCSPPPDVRCIPTRFAW